MVVYESFSPDGTIPVTDWIRDRKLVKYLSREAAAATVAACKLHRQTSFGPTTPIYYATCRPESEDFGLYEMAVASRGENGAFDPQTFIGKGLLAVSPLYQFKVLQNTALSLISMTLGLTGEHAVVYVEAGSLLTQALLHPASEKLIVGAGKTGVCGSAESGFALVERDRLANSRWIGSRAEAVEMLRSWAREGLS